ncbi:MAG: hypothetical protein HYX27_28105 [Acidobacteria bacterium]|nr:hypothetical protein [Acidobacteriota bacterium]
MRSLASGIAAGNTPKGTLSAATQNRRCPAAFFPAPDKATTLPQFSDFGSKNLAQGYQALVIPDRPRVADPVTTAPSGTGEQPIH